MEFLKNFILNLLRSTAVQAVLLNVIGATVGLKAKIATFVVEHLFDYIVEPVVELAIRKGLLIYDKAEGKILVKKLKEASEEGNVTSWNDTVDKL